MIWRLQSQVQKYKTYHFSIIMDMKKKILSSIITLLAIGSILPLYFFVYIEKGDSAIIFIVAEPFFESCGIKSIRSPGAEIDCYRQFFPANTGGNG